MGNHVKGMKEKITKTHYKVYGNYSKYVEHQKSKLKHKLETQDKQLLNYDKKYCEALTNRLLDNHIAYGNVLCLGARIGTEVKAFFKRGCFAVGIDLITSPDNKYVLYGDFHNLQFHSNTVDTVFTNSLDHVLDINKVLNEIKRVLKPNGYFIAEIVLKQDIKTSRHESFFWSKIDDVIDIIVDAGFKLLKRDPFEYPWKGEHCIFKLN